MRQFALALVLLPAFVPSAFAQDALGKRFGSTPPGVVVLADFQIYAVLDSPAPGSISVVSRSEDLTLGGWAFERRSGLQPATQRVGDVGVRFVNVNTGEEFLPVSAKPVFGPRPDVQVAYGSVFPAVGRQAGLSIIIKGLPPPNMYRMEVLIDTFDYAGRYTAVVIQRTVIITE